MIFVRINHFFMSENNGLFKYNLLRVHYTNLNTKELKENKWFKLFKEWPIFIYELKYKLSKIEEWEFYVLTIIKNDFVWKFEK